MASHETQLAPLVPQLGNAGTVHAPPAQQPAGQEAGLQTHAPAEHTRPAPHAGPAPHLHAPAVQLSALPLAQATHAMPPEPQAPSEGELHVSPEQQPVEHIDVHPLHAPLLHVSVPAQPWQAEPPLPQAVPTLPGSQTFPVQQPVGQDVPSQTQVPPRHRWPVVHATPLPHEHAPFASH